MTQSDWFAEAFEEKRAHLRAVAYRMLGSTEEAEDAVQEAWLRVSRADTAAVQNLGGWLTTITARICLDQLRSRGARKEVSIPDERAQSPSSDRAAWPAANLELADSVGPALLVVLETLGPAERVAFVLHDLFDLSFDEIAPIVGRSPEAARQLASRARRRVRGGTAETHVDVDRHREVVAAFLAASRGGDVGALLAALAPDVVLRVDDAARRAAASNSWGGAERLESEVRGKPAVADVFKGGRSRGLRTALIDGEPGAVFVIEGQPQVAWIFAIVGAAIVEIDLVMDPARLCELELVL